MMLPIYTKITEDGEYIHLGDAEVEIPVAFQIDLDKEISLTTEGPHSRACGIRPHTHGLACAKDCPTCHPMKGHTHVSEEDCPTCQSGGHKRSGLTNSQLDVERA